jgi:hypothetical protein
VGADKGAGKLYQQTSPSFKKSQSASANATICNVVLPAVANDRVSHYGALFGALRPHCGLSIGRQPWRNTNAVDYSRGDGLLAASFSTARATVLRASVSLALGDEPISGAPLQTKHHAVVLVALAWS